MDAGPALDAEIQRRLFGWQWYRNPSDGPSTVYGKRFLQDPDYATSLPDVFVPATGDEPIYHNDSIPPYSTDIAAAWAVVERMADLGWWVDIDSSPVTDDTATGPWAVCFVVQRTDTIGSGGAHHAPLAICRAALAALDALGA